MTTLEECLLFSAFLIACILCRYAIKRNTEARGREDASSRLAQAVEDAIKTLGEGRKEVDVLTLGQIYMTYAILPGSVWHWRGTPFSRIKGKDGTYLEGFSLQLDADSGRDGTARTVAVRQGRWCGRDMIAITICKEGT